MNLRKGLFGHWSMDGRDIDEGFVRDCSAYSIHGQIQDDEGVEIGQSGRINESIWFDGESGNVQVANPLVVEGDETFSVAFWFKAESDVDNEPDIIGAPRRNTSNGWGIYNDVDSNGRIYLEVNGDNNTRARARISSGSLSLNTWYFAYCHYDGGEVLTRVVGVDTAVTELEDEGKVFEDEMNIGRRGGDSSRLFRGNISDLRLYNRTLSEDEVEALYNMRNRRSQRDRLSEGLVGHWTNDVKDTDSGIHRDRSGRSSHGEILGSPDVVDGVIDQAYSFGGSEDQDSIEAENVNFRDEFVNGFAVSHWLYLPVDFREDQMTSHPTSASNFSSTGSSRSYSGFKNNSNVRFAVGSSEEDEWHRISYSDYDLEQWMHLIGVWRPDGSMEIWRDGELVETGSSEGFTPKVFDRFGIGGHSEDENWIQARIDDVRWYKRDISEKEIKMLYQLRNRR